MNKTGERPAARSDTDDDITTDEVVATGKEAIAKYADGLESADEAVAVLNATDRRLKKLQQEKRREDRRSRGQELWRLMRDEHVTSCELRDDRDTHAGCEVRIWFDDEILFARHCADEKEARHFASALRQDYVGSDWAELPQ